MSSQWLPIAAAGLLVFPVGAQEPDPAAINPAAHVHWATQLGLRSLQTDVWFPVVDQVVLVPDGATYLDELARWSHMGRWPILFEDDEDAPRFIRRFRPARVLVREAVDASTLDREQRRAQMERIVSHTWGSEAETDSPASTFEARGFVPPGVVIMSTDDPAWAAGVALAAGRGLVPLWMDESCGDPDQTVDAQQFFELRSRIRTLIANLDLPFDTIGDAIETITLCRAWPGRVSIDLPQEQQIPIAERYREGPIALTDALGRNDDWSRFAFTGWIFGDEARSAYVAMCSLFLSRQSVDLIDTYPDEPVWRPYHFDAAQQTLLDAGFEVEVAPKEKLDRAGWGERLAAGFENDVLLMNSRGGAQRFFLARGRAATEDVPVHHVPVAVHLIHSWSVQRPGDESTVAGRWLAHGAYAFVGSVHEPLLNAFVPPSALAERLGGLVPFLVAARWWESDGMFSRPWRVNTFGDPLMVCPAPQSVPMDRVAPAARDGLDLAEHAREMAELVDLKPALEVYAEAVRTNVLLGRDDEAIQLWREARLRGVGQQAAFHVLGPLFRAGLTDDFELAWTETDEPTPLQRDMLWHRLGPTIGPDLRVERLEVLWDAIRPPRPHIDARRLVGHVDRHYGRDEVRARIAEAIERTSENASRKALRDLLVKYPQ